MPESPLRFLFLLVWYLVSSLVMMIVGGMLIRLGLFGEFKLNGESSLAVRFSVIFVGSVLVASGLVNMRKGP